MARGAPLVTALVGCVAAQHPPETERTWTVAELWAEEPTGVLRVRAVVASPRTSDGEAFFVQDPGGGPGLRVDLVGALPALPPPVGTEVALAGRLAWSELGPTLGVDDDEAVAALAEGEAVAVPWAPGHGFSLVSLEDVAVTSPPDPLGHADTDAGIGLDGAFTRALPGWGAVGDLVGIVTSEGRVAPRSAEDWTGPLAAAPPVEVEGTATGGLAEGTPVLLSGVVQASPWSLDGRWVVVQDAEGRGLWVDAEGFFEPETAAGDVLDLWGEVRAGGLRTWLAPQAVGSSEVLAGESLVDGAILTLTVTVVEGPDRFGRYTTAEGVALDDRFGPLDLAGTVTVTGAVEGTATLHPF